jgi:hypothetical protein
MGGEFSSADSQVRNPIELLDAIKVKRNQIKKKIEDGYELLVECSIVDNKVDFIKLYARNSDYISVIKESLKEKMGRPADNSEKSNTEPVNGRAGYIIDSEWWFLSDNRRATAFTYITVPYGSSSISDQKWVGGVELIVNNRDTSEWNYLKQQEALTEEKKKERVRRLLE